MSDRSLAAGATDARVAGPVVVLLGGGAVAASLARRTATTVVTASAEGHLDAAERAGRAGGLVIGLSTVPWPAAEALHRDASARLPAYTGVVSWHGHELLHDRLATAVGPAAAGGAHVLFTAPDPGPDTAPEGLTFLREVAAGVGERVHLPSASIAWRGRTRSPTAEDALASLVEVHGRRAILECPIVPGTGADPVLEERARVLGARFTCVDPGRDALIDVLAAVVRTVAAHEGV